MTELQLACKLMFDDFCYIATICIGVNGNLCNECFTILLRSQEQCVLLEADTDIYKRLPFSCIQNLFTKEGTERVIVIVECQSLLKSKHQSCSIVQ